MLQLFLYSQFIDINICFCLILFIPLQHHKNDLAYGHED